MTLDFTPRSLPPTCQRFAKCDDPIRFIVGPVGSGKSTACVREIARRALRQRRGPDGLRHSRWAVIRNTYGQLRDTTRKTYEQWIPSQLGVWREQPFVHELAVDDVRAEVLFRALDRPEDVKKLLSLELTGAYVNEVREVPKHIVDVLETRVGRYPAQRDGGPTWSGIWADSNPWHSGHWGAKLFAKGLPGYSLFRQPGGRSPQAENIENLPRGYYDRLCVGKDKEWIRVYVDGEDASGAVGAIWGAWIAAIEAPLGSPLRIREGQPPMQGRICAFDHPSADVHTTWDLGHADSTGIWFWRINADRHIDVIDHYESAGDGLSHYFGVVDGKGYKYAHHWLPHDAEAETLATQQTVIEQCREHWGRGMVDLVPSIGLDDGISAARWLLEQPIRIHERCAVPGRLEYSGVDALREYRYEWDENNQCFSRTPLHNWASHTADAFRYVAVVVKHVERMTRPAAPKPPGTIVIPTRPTIDQLFESMPAPSGRI